MVPHVESLFSFSQFPSPVRLKGYFVYFNFIDKLQAANSWAKGHVQRVNHHFQHIIKIARTKNFTEMGVLTFASLFFTF